jgi:hypothetical protein
MVIALRAGSQEGSMDSLSYGCTSLNDDTLVTSKEDQILVGWVGQEDTNNWETVATFIP